MSHNSKSRIFCLLWLFLFPGCTPPPLPPEADEAVRQEQDLWRKGAPEFSPKEYEQYRMRLAAAQEALRKEEGRLVLLRDYEPVGQEFASLLAEGKGLSLLIETRRKSQTDNAQGRLTELKERTRSLSELSGLMNEGRLIRSLVTRAELMAAEAKGLIRDRRFKEAGERITTGQAHLDRAVKMLRPIAERLSDDGEIKNWHNWIDGTIRESKRTGGYAVVVSKADGRLTLYRGGVPKKSYSVGLGFNGMTDKLRAGDRATPEGRYRITRKNPASRYHRALLLDYPNDEDRRRFSAAKKKGLIPKNASIGALIEIHGGGRNSMTYGCIGLEDDEMEELYALLPVGTPVTIVGAESAQNRITEAMKDL